ncbi:MAG: DMT family transporter [Chloroflexi bacterium]|nr:DMT family transporter [Chloroflexota bacterium]
MNRLLALLGTLGISFSAVWVRLADVSPTTAAFFRTLYAFPILLILWLFLRHRDNRPAGLRLLAVASGLLLAIDLTIFHRTIALIGAGLATVLANTQVVFVGLAAWHLYRERPKPLTFFTVPLVLLGALFISGLGQRGSYGQDPLGGMILGVLDGAVYAGFLLVFRSANRQMSTPVGPLLDTTGGAVVGALLIGLLDPGFQFAVSWPAHAWLLALALISQVGSWLLIATALPRLPALETSVILLLQPMATVLWGFLIFAEHLSLIQWSGVALVLGGVGMLSLRGSVDRDRSAQVDA